MLTRFSAFVALALMATAATASVVDRSVHRALASATTVDLIVRFKQPTNVLESFQEAAYTDRGERITALKKDLEAANGLALEPLRELFAKEAATGVEFTPYWIAPLASIKNATFEIVEKLAGLPNIESVREARAYPLPKTKQAVKHGRGLKSESQMWYQNDAGTSWGVWKVNAPAVWATGNTGQGIRVGGLDSGVNGNHEALKNNFGGDYSWFDPELKTSAPHDDAGHGSHTMGTAVGAYPIGVAPGATWVACRGCRTESCPDADLLECGQFLLCPTKPDGSDPDCSKAPRVINNSWSGVPGEEFFVEVVAAWVKAGIIPVFSAGNEGQCTFSPSPGDFANVISVGSTTKTDGLSDFSSMGPTNDGRIKPDLSAPGSEIISAFDAFDDYYALIDGTSMAAPHVTGAIALLLNAEPTLTLEQVRARLAATTEQKRLLPTNQTCGGTVDGTWPNNMYGHGRLDVYSAIKGARVAAPAMIPAPTQAPLDQFSTPATSPKQ